jgi:hypothetical protein
VECQFKSLQSCSRSEYHLDRMLRSLPESLDETYERMLCNIDNHAIEDARRVLSLLCFASRPLKVQELIDGMAVEILNGVGLNQKRRLQDANDIHGICPGLIEIGLDSTSLTEALDEEHGPHFVPTVRMAHFLVQEYLESERIRHQRAAIFSLSSATAHSEISQVCLLYLLEPALSTSTPVENLLEKYPLGRFAAEFWYYHYQEADRPDELNGIILKLFQQQDSFTTWVRFYDIDNATRYGYSTGSPVYYASLLGLDQVLGDLVYVKQPETKTEFSRALPHGASVSQTIRAESRFPSNVLQVESLSGAGPAVQQLLENRANDNSQNGRYSNTQQVMLSEDRDSVTELLLNKRPDVNAQDGKYGNALQAASYGGHESVVQLLLDKGADVNAQGGTHNTALQASSFQGHKSVVQLLLDNGVDVNAQGGLYGNALQVALLKGHILIVQWLLDNGADVNAQGGHCGNALQAASYGGHESVVQQLLGKGVDINAQGGSFGNALQAASRGGHESIV